MICAKVVKDTKREKSLRDSLNKVGDILKEESWTTRSKHVTIKELEDKIVALS